MYRLRKRYNVVIIRTMFRLSILRKGYNDVVLKSISNLRKRNIIKSFEEIVLKYISRLRKDSSNNTFIMFSSYEEALKWGKDNYSTWTCSLSKEEYENIQDFTGNVYKIINRYLRGTLSECFEQPFYRKCENRISLIDNAINKTFVTNNIIVYRWMEFTAFCQLTKCWSGKVQIGDILRDNAYLSTSLLYDKIPSTIDDREDSKLVLLIIRIPKGAKGAFIAEISVVGAECEFLLGRGQNLKVSKVIYNKGNNVILLCDVLL